MNRQQDVTITVDEEEEFELLPAMGEFSSIASQYEHIMFFYESGIQQIVAKLQILNNEFKNNNERNPIENIKSRVKSMESIIDKMQRKGIPLTMNSMAKEIKDIAGVRVICPFISDVYHYYLCGRRLNEEIWLFRQSRGLFEGSRHGGKAF